MKQQVRIISGQWKRQLIDFAEIEGLRPTPDRVRETVFNWLMWDIQNANVLDVCTGSGAFSFESLSRGANHVVMIEPNQIQSHYLSRNLQRLQIHNAQLFTETAQKIIPTLKEQFDIAFIDPPYRLNLWQELAELVNPIIKVNGLIYIEANQELIKLQLPQQWQCIKHSKAGRIYFALFQKIGIE